MTRGTVSTNQEEGAGRGENKRVEGWKDGAMKEKKRRLATAMQF